MTIFEFPPTATIEWASIGWDSDDDESYYDLGTADNDGYTLVKVQLYKGRDDSKPLLKDGRAHGTKMVCHLNSSLQRIPPRNTRCMIAIPAGLETNPAAGMIIATAEKTTDGRLERDRVIFDYGDQHVVIKGKSVSISSNDNEFMSVGTPRSGGTPGLTFQAADGSGGIVQEGVVSWWVADNGDAVSVLQMGSNKIDLMHKAAKLHKVTFTSSGIDILTPATLNVFGNTVVLGPPGTGLNSPNPGPNPFYLAAACGPAGGGQSKCVLISNG